MHLHNAFAYALLLGRAYLIAGRALPPDPEHNAISSSLYHEQIDTIEGRIIAKRADVVVEPDPIIPEDPDEPSGNGLEGEGSGSGNRVSGPKPVTVDPNAAPADPVPADLWGSVPEALKTGLGREAYDIFIRYRKTPRPQPPEGAQYMFSSGDFFDAEGQNTKALFVHTKGLNVYGWENRYTKDDKEMSEQLDKWGEEHKGDDDEHFLPGAIMSWDIALEARQQPGEIILVMESKKDPLIGTQRFWGRVEVWLLTDPVESKVTAIRRYNIDDGDDNPNGQVVWTPDMGQMGYPYDFTDSPQNTDPPIDGAIPDGVTTGPTPPISSDDDSSGLSDHSDSEFADINLDS